MTYFDFDGAAIDAISRTLTLQQLWDLYFRTVLRRVFTVAPTRRLISVSDLVSVTERPAKRQRLMEGNNKKTRTLSDLPVHLLQLVFSFTTSTNIRVATMGMGNIALTCKALRNAALNDHFMRPIVRLDCALSARMLALHYPQGVRHIELSFAQGSREPERSTFTAQFTLHVAEELMNSEVYPHVQSIYIAWNPAIQAAVKSWTPDQWNYIFSRLAITSGAQLVHLSMPWVMAIAEDVFAPLVPLHDRVKTATRAEYNTFHERDVVELLMNFKGNKDDVTAPLDPEVVQHILSHTHNLNPLELLAHVFQLWPIGYVMPAWGGINLPRNPAAEPRPSPFAVRIPQIMTTTWQDIATICMAICKRYGAQLARSDPVLLSVILSFSTKSNYALMVSTATEFMERVVGVDNFDFKQTTPYFAANVLQDFCLMPEFVMLFRDRVIPTAAHFMNFNKSNYDHERVHDFYDARDVLPDLLKDLSQQPYKQQALGNRVHAFTLARLLGLTDFAAPDQMNVTRFAIQVPFTSREEMTFYLAFECKRALELYLPTTRFLHDNKQLCVDEQATSRFMYNVANDVFKALESRVKIVYSDPVYQRVEQFSTVRLIHHNFYHAAIDRIVSESTRNMDHYLQEFIRTVGPAAEQETRRQEDQHDLHLTQLFEIVEQDEGDHIDTLFNDIE